MLLISLATIPLSLLALKALHVRQQTEQASTLPQLTLTLKLPLESCIQEAHIQRATESCCHITTSKTTSRVVRKQQFVIQITAIKITGKKPGPARGPI